MRVRSSVYVAYAGMVGVRACAGCSVFMCGVGMCTCTCAQGVCASARARVYTSRNQIIFRTHLTLPGSIR